MSFLDLLGVDIEKKTRETIQTCLEEIAIEYNCSHKDFFVMIKPVTDDFLMKFYIYINNENGAPQFKREISLGEILGKEE